MQAWKRALLAWTLLVPAALAGPPPDAADIFDWPPDLQEVGYRNIEKIGPTRAVKHGDSVYPLPVAEKLIDPKATVDGVEYDTEHFMAANRVSGIVALKNGRIVLERYGLGRRPEDRWISWSVTKSVTSTLTGAALRDGYIRSLDDPVTRYVPQLKGSAYDAVSVSQLLAMSSGVKWSEDGADPASDVRQAGYLIPTSPIHPLLSYLKRLPRAAPAGTRFNYNSGEADLAGILVSNAVGKTLAQYLSDKIWASFGMEQDAVWAVDAAGHERGSCCLAMTLRDYARFGLFMLGGGVAAGKQVLPPGWVEDATAMHFADTGDGSGYGYGYFWWTGPHVYQAQGIFGQALVIVPKNQLVVAINSAWPSPVDGPSWVRKEAFVQAISDAVR